MRSHGTHETGRIQTQLTLRIPVLQMELNEFAYGSKFVRYCANINVVLNIIKSILQDKYTV